MTRQYTVRPTWSWYCDRCGQSSGDLKWEADWLPSVEEMRARGWFIAENYGDLCLGCRVSDEKEQEEQK